MDKKLDKTKYKLDLINQWISNCDTKSSFLLAFYGVVVTIIMTTKLADKMVQTFKLRPSFKDINLDSILNLIEFIVLLVMVYFVIKCFYHIYFTLKARIDSSLYQQEDLVTESNIFFQSISKKTYKDFNNKNSTENDTEFLSDLTSQVFINSNIATEKFENYNKSISSGFWGLILMLLYLFI